MTSVPGFWRLWRSYRLAYKDARQKTRTVFIPRDQLGRVKKMISNYGRVRKITKQLIVINVKLFKQTARQPPD